MTILIIASLIDPASVNIADKLIKEFGFEESGRTFSGKPVYKKDDLLLAYLDGMTYMRKTLTKSSKLKK